MESQRELQHVEFLVDEATPAGIDFLLARREVNGAERVKDGEQGAGLEFVGSEGLLQLTFDCGQSCPHAHPHV